MDQFGFININQMASADREKELRIVREVAGYGKQLGRINEALKVLVKHSDDSKYDPDEREALARFSKMVREIAEAKGDYVAPTEQELDHLLGEIRDLKDRDSKTYRNMLTRLREFTEAERTE